MAQQSDGVLMASCGKVKVELAIHQVANLSLGCHLCGGWRIVIKLYVF